VVIELDHEHIVQIITDNGSNLNHKMITDQYQIVWQPFLTHTINLMLKSIGDFPEHEAMIEAS
jgi:hypothetical protein